MKKKIKLFTASILMAFLWFPIANAKFVQHEQLTIDIVVEAKQFVENQNYTKAMEVYERFIQPIKNGEYVVDIMENLSGSSYAYLITDYFYMLQATKTEEQILEELAEIEVGYFRQSASFDGRNIGFYLGLISLELQILFDQNKIQRFVSATETARYIHRQVLLSEHNASCAKHENCPAFDQKFQDFQFRDILFKTMRYRKRLDVFEELEKTVFATDNKT